LLYRRIPLPKQGSHIAAEECDLGQSSKNRQRRRKTKYVLHLRFVGGQRPKEVVVLHESEDPLNHGVLKVSRPIHRRDLASKVVPHPKVLRPPGDTLRQADQAGGDSARSYRRFSRMDVSGEVYFHTPRQIETSLHRCMDYGKILQRHHAFTSRPLPPTSGCDSAPAYG